MEERRSSPRLAGVIRSAQQVQYSRSLSWSCKHKRASNQRNICAVEISCVVTVSSSNKECCPTHQSMVEVATTRTQGGTAGTTRVARPSSCHRSVSTWTCVRALQVYQSPLCNSMIRTHWTVQVCKMMRSSSNHSNMSSATSIRRDLTQQAVR